MENKDNISYLTDTDSLSSYSIDIGNDPLYYRYNKSQFLGLTKYNLRLGQNPSLKSTLWICFYSWLISVFEYGPFIIFNIYFSFYDTKPNQMCLNSGIPNTPHDLNAWLIGDSLCLFFSSFILCVSVVYKKNFNKLSAFLKFFNYFVMFANLSVGLFGSVLYWKYVYPSNTCSVQINVYMWIRLISNYIIILIHWLLIK